MNIVIATPLYPPDIGGSAPYAKDIATYLAKKHKVTIVTYARHPEKIDGVNIISVNKRQLLLKRILSYMRVLWNVVKDADVIYTLNGASVELPATFISFIKRKSLIIYVGDKVAYKYAEKNLLLKFVKISASKQADIVINDELPEKPEILPFNLTDNNLVVSYERAWEKHISLLNNTFQKYEE
jgi:glycosyltransferase involved in cell wall biosynthesis